MSEHPSEHHQLHFNGQLIETDAKGYLRHSEEWSEALALVPAGRDPKDLFGLLRTPVSRRERDVLPA